MGRIAAVILAAVVAGTASAAPAPVPEAIEIAQGETKLKALLYRPQGNGPFPAVVGLHGCEGLAGTRSPFGRRYREGRAASRGGLRGGVSRRASARASSGRSAMSASAECVPAASGSATSRRRAAGCRSRAMSRRTASRCSAGPTAPSPALWTVRPRTAKDGKPDFRSAVALYPGCRRLRDTAWSARMPSLILVGARDDWTPANLCEQMVAGARGRSAQAAIVVYPGAYHNFDHPNLPLQRRTGIAFATGATGRVHVGTDTAARNDAFRRVPEWLAR
jgi:dienelactone hydrolase